MFVDVEDFEGKYQLHRGVFDVAKINSYIDKYERRYLVELLGKDLYDEFIADLDPFEQPQSPRFIAIFNPLEEDYNWTIIYSEGMIEMLKGFIYFEYVKDLTNQMTVVGNVLPVGENSQQASTLYSMMYARYNEAVRTYKAIQTYITQHSGDYAEFNGKKKELAYWI